MALISWLAIGTAVAYPILVRIDPIGQHAHLTRQVAVDEVVRSPASANSVARVSGPIVVQAERTETTPAEIRKALSAAHTKATGGILSEPALDVLVAHVSHETGRGAKMYNFNFGGIKGQSPEGATANYRTTEYTAGAPAKMTDGFRAYGSLESGATDYLSLLERRYPEALRAAEAGNATGFAAALKSRGYFTAPLEMYANSLRGLLGDDAPAAPVDVAGAGAISSASSGRALRPASFDFDPNLLLPPGSPVGATSLPTTIDILRILDSMAELSMKIATSDEQDSSTNFFS